jgi:anti-anti-sigma factor
MTSDPGFTVTLFSTHDRVLLRCSGEIDLSNVHLLREPLDEHLTDSSRELTVDLCDVFYLDSTAILELWRAAVVLSRQGRELRVRVTPRQEKLFVLSRCDRLLVLEACGSGIDRSGRKGEKTLIRF